MHASSLFETELLGVLFRFVESVLRSGFGIWDTRDVRRGGSILVFLVVPTREYVCSDAVEFRERIALAEREDAVIG